MADLDWIEVNTAYGDMSKKVCVNRSQILYAYPSNDGTELIFSGGSADGLIRLIVKETPQQIATMSAIRPHARSGSTELRY